MIRVPSPLRARSLRCWATLAALSLPGAVFACPNCPNLGPPLAEQIASADAALIVSWQSGEKGDVDRGYSGKTVYLVKDVLRDQTGRLKPGQTLSLESFHAGKPGDQALLLGSGETMIDWNPPFPMSDAAVRYLHGAPASTASARERLAYALRFLDDADAVISNDAFTEFAAASYHDVKLVAAGVSAERVRGWLSDPLCDPLRIGFFGMLLGIVGSKQDVAFLENRILEPVEFRAGEDGLISGYLLLTHDTGLDLIDRTKLRNREAVGAEKLSVMNALRFLWTYVPDCISRERLRASMRLVLDYPPLADVAIVDLARWQDWSATGRLIELYADPAYSEPLIRQAIVKFMLVAQRVKPAPGTNTPTEDARTASRFIEQLRKDDPDAVREAERRLFVQ